MSEESAPKSERATQQGCLSAALFGITLLWVASLALLPLLGGWVLEQTLFEGSLGAPDLRWLVILAYALGLLLPLGLLQHFVQHAHTRAIYRTWFWAALLSVLVLPARWLALTDSQNVALLQIAALIVLIVLLSVRRPRRALMRSGLGWGAAAGALCGVPLVVWGALGSPLDLILAGATAGLVGWAAALNLDRHLLPPAGQPYPLKSFVVDGLAAAVMLLILTAALGQNGNQWVLALVLPVWGWALVALGRLGVQAEAGRSAVLVMALPAALAVFWPLALLDADELALVTASGTGELLSWAVRAAMVQMGIGLLLSMAFGSLVQLLEGAQHLRRAGWWAAGLAVVGLAAAYVLLGQTGFYGERLFVVFSSQADLSAEKAIVDPLQRRTAVYEKLVRHADAGQKDLLTVLDRWKIPYQRFYLENAVEVTGGPLLRAWISSLPGVDRVLDNPVLRPLPEAVPVSAGMDAAPQETPWNLKLIHADRVWNELGITGKGVVVGQSDSGAQGDHPELADSYRGRQTGNDYNWLDPWNGSPSPVDIGGHGTHTLGSILGDRVGVAPDAEWIGCVNLGRNLGNPALYLTCMQFMLAPFPQGGDPLRDGDAARGAQVINNSWGCPPVEGCDPQALDAAVYALRSAGVFVVASAGNSGYVGCGSVSDPIATSNWVVSVGAVDSRGELAVFSSLGPVTVDGSQRRKPDIAAPGDGVLSSFPGGTYSTASGTSMAGPHVVGVVALMWSANPALIGNVERTEQLLVETAQPYSGALPECVQGEARNAVGAGIVDAYAAVQAALAEPH